MTWRWPRRSPRSPKSWTCTLPAPTDPEQTRLNAEIETLREASLGYPPTLANTLINLLSHAEVLLTKQAPTEELFEAATSNRISGLTDELVSNLRFELGRKEVEIANYDRGLLVVIALLALFWILLALHQRRKGGAVAAAAGPVIAPAAGATAPTARADDRPSPVPVPAQSRRVAPPDGTQAHSAEADLERMTVNGFVVNCGCRHPRRVG